jgi:hypothetical protein
VSGTVLIPRRFGHIRMPGFLIRVHPRDFTEVNVAVHQTGGQEQARAVQHNTVLI